MPDSPLHTERIAVRWGDMDALGHVNNSRYLTYVEQARVAWLQAHDGAWDAGVGPVLARVTLDFRRPVTYPATLEVALTVAAVGRSSLTLHHAVQVEEADAVAAEGEAVVVWIDYATGRPVPLPDVLRQRLGARGQ